ncbi:MAG: VCBS repeat-containing protein [Cyanobacteria bacterium J06649_11]
MFSPLTITTDSIEIISDIPTVHYLSLVIDGEEVDRAFIQHLSCNWESFSLASTDTIMHESCHTIKNGIGYVPPILIDSESESSFYTRFVEIEKYGISADTLDLTVQLKNHPSEGGNACLAAEIVVYGSEQAVRFIIADEYCIQNQGGYLRPSAFTTVSTAGLSMLEWQNIQCRVNGDSIKLITNGISFSSSLQSNMGELLGVAVDFQGSGSIDNLLIDATDMGNGYYEERFDECNCQGDTIVTQPTLISLKKNELRIAYPQNLHPNATTNNWLTVFGDLTGKYPGSTRRDGNQLVFLANRNFLAGEELHITSLDSIQFLDHTNSEPFVWKVIAPVTHQTQGRFFLKPLGVQVPDGALDYGYDFRTADFNIDGRMDIGFRYKPVSGGSGGGGTNILIYLQNSNGGYQAPDLYFNFWNYSSFDGTPDLNGDGYPDLMIRHNIISSAMVRLNDGTGHFSSGQYFNVRNFSNGLVYGDIDSDGDLDILSPSGYSPISGNATSILRNNGSAQFSESLFGPRLFNSSRHLADLDKDGDLDFIFTSNDAFNSPKKLQVYSNNGLGQFSLSYDQNNPEQITIAQVVDFNGDGKQDLFSTSPFEGIIYGDGSLDYDLDALISLDSLRTTSVIIDVNGDQRYDILTPRIYDGSSWLSYPLKAKIKDDDQQLIVWQGVDTLLREARHAVDFDMDGDIDHLTIDAEGNIFLLENVDSKIYLNIRVALAGPYDANSGLMNDNLRALGLLPEVDPYGFDCQRVQPGVLDIADTTAIVDWVLLELRPETDVDEILFRQSALIRRDGYIVGMDGKSPIQFDQLIPAGYHIVVKHRNHLAVMTEAPFTVSLRDIITVNFLDQLTPTYGVAAQYIQSDSKATMYSGDAVPDGQVNAVDKNAVWRLTNGLPFNYRQSSADFNLDGTTNAVDANAHWRIHNSRSSNINY